MKIKKIIWPAIGILCALIYSISSINIKKGEQFSIAVELANPISITWPMQVVIAGDEGEKALRIAPNIGRGWKGEAGGHAEYKFYIPQTGKYYLWFYSLWFDECSNAIFVQIDNSEKNILGNNPVYNKWHWGRGFDIDLTEGTHQMIVSNHSDHIAIQKILLINSESAKPEDSSVIFSDIFYEGFDGCDQGNFSQWQKINGQWMVTNPINQTNYSENVLQGQANDNNALIIYKLNPWINYSLNLKLKANLSGQKSKGVAVCFGLKNKDQYYKLEFTKSKNNNKALAMIIFKNGSKENILKSFEVEWQDEKWQPLEISLFEKSIAVNLANKNTMQIESNAKISGTIGLELTKQTKAWFDDIHVRSIEKLKTNQP